MTRRKTGAARRLTAVIELAGALDEWDLLMRQLNRFPETRKTYATAVTQLERHQAARGRATTVDRITPTDVRSYLVSVLERASASTAVTRWGGLLAFFKWAASEGLCRADSTAHASSSCPGCWAHAARATHEACSRGFCG